MVVSSASVRAVGAGARPLRLMVVEDHPMVRRGLVDLLSRQDGLQVCAQAGDGGTALRLFLLHDPDVVLVDVTLPDISGIEVIRRIHQLRPGARMLAVSMHDDAIYRDVAAAAGAMGYVNKAQAVELLLDAVQQVASGHAYRHDTVIPPTFCLL